jgi:hypothetical protein
MSNVTHDERVEYEMRILSLEMELERVRKILTPFATKACGWEQNHPGHLGTDSMQISHRLGDFRAARASLNRLDRIAEGLVETSFAFCCAEGGGSVLGCDCVKKDHGVAWSNSAMIKDHAA